MSTLAIIMVSRCPVLRCPPLLSGAALSGLAMSVPTILMSVLAISVAPKAVPIRQDTYRTEHNYALCRFGRLRGAYASILGNCRHLHVYRPVWGIFISYRPRLTSPL